MDSTIFLVGTRGAFFGGGAEGLDLTTFAAVAALAGLTAVLAITLELLAFFVLSTFAGFATAFVAGLAAGFLTVFVTVFATALTTGLAADLAAGFVACFATGFLDVFEGIAGLRLTK
ncbi:MAG: hypothetical protein ACK5A0_04820 [Polaromonas sp.]